MKKSDIKTDVGELLVIMITGEINSYIAEVVEQEPLTIKVLEEGLYSNLKGEDFIISTVGSLLIQGNDEIQQDLLKNAVNMGHPFLSGLKQLGVTDNKLHTILPIL